MREIKFRAWINNKMEYNPIIPLLTGESRVNVNDIFQVIMFGERINWMQYTGLKDKNGKEIYFGDICKVDWNDKRYPVHNVEISWNEEECSIDIEGGSPKRDCENHYEVIGNIYDNPELLKN